MPEQPVNDEQAEIKKRAMRRMAVAASLVAVAAVALTVLNNKKAELPQPVTTSTAPIMERPAPALPEARAEKPQEEEKPAEPPAQLSAEQTPPATPTAPPPPQVINKPESSGAANAKPRAETTAVPPMVNRQSPEALKPAIPAIAPRQPAPATSAASEQKSEQKPVIVQHQPAKPSAEPSPPKAYVVQLGLFTNPDNALQLQKRLAEHGIKSYTETRLQVGPFQTKAEADQAQARIRSLGINAVLAPVR